MIAVEVFGRDAGYDPKIDGIVRTEAMRLRTRVDKYYANEGSLDPVVIELPKGGYRPVLRQRTTAAPAAADRVGRTAWIAGRRRRFIGSTPGEDHRGVARRARVEGDDSFCGLVPAAEGMSELCLAELEAAVERD